jgi:hypothetical protein
VEVVLREIERSACLTEVGRHGMSDLDRLLTAVGECPEAEGLGAQRTLVRRPNWRQRPAWKRNIRVRSIG